MKIIQRLLATSAMGLCLLGGRSLLADTTPVVVPPSGGDRDLIRDLRNAPPEVKTLIMRFDATRDRFLAEQRKLLQMGKGATAEERARIREQLQDNRQAFLAQLKTFREDLRKDLQDLRGKINPGELRRILDAARDAATDKDRHRGRN